MRAKKLVTGIIISLILIAVLLAVTNRPSKAQGQDEGDAGAQVRDKNQDMPAKLNEVLDAQKEVIKRLDDMKEELRIIKVRVTQMQ